MELRQLTGLVYLRLLTLYIRAIIG